MKSDPLTPEMISAGVASLIKTTEGQAWVYENIVASVYRAMRALEPVGHDDAT